MSTKALRLLPLFSVFPNPDQPRKKFDPAKLEELAASIKANGLLQPIKVRPMGQDAWMIVAGERRWRAHCLLADRGQLPGCQIAAIVESVDDRRMAIEAILENLQRADVTPMEEAYAFKRMIEGGMSERELGQALGLTQSWRIRDRLRLLNLAPEHIKLFESGNLAAEAVYEISRLERHADQTKIVQMIGRGQLTGYKAIKAAVAAILDGLSQDDIFGGSTRKASKRELDTVARMEAKIASIATMIAAGWRDGECIVARKVAPDKARLMADKLKVIQSHCRQMENELREAAAQAAMAL